MLAACLSDPRIVKKIGAGEIRRSFDLGRLLRYVPAIVRRALRT
jgi:hypothetical protein